MTKAIDMGPSWGTDKKVGPFARRQPEMSDSDCADLGSATVGAWNILAHDRCSEYVFWTPGTAKIHCDDDEETSRTEWQAWLSEVNSELHRLEGQPDGSYSTIAKALIAWARTVAEQDTGYASNTSELQDWLDECDAVVSWTEVGENLLRFKFDPQTNVELIPGGVEFTSSGTLGKKAAAALEGNVR